MIDTNLIYIFEMLFGIIIIACLLIAKKIKTKQNNHREPYYNGILVGMGIMAGGINVCIVILKIYQYLK